MSEYLVVRIRAAPNISVPVGTEIAAVHGERRIESVSLKGYSPNGEAKVAGQPSTPLTVGTIFVFTGAEPGCACLPDTIARDRLGCLLTGAETLRSGKWPLKDREPCPLETKIPGILAAGDIRAGSTKRVGFAVGDGSLAATCIHKLIAIRN